jgi:pantoate--beta-alanine ligase
MKIVYSVKEMINLAYTYRSGGKTIGFIPTMGALHRGHLSLLAIAQKHADVSIMSIFVNPTQFGPNEDFAKYPRPFETDCRLAQEAGCDIIFAPPVSEMYPNEHLTSVMISGITERLCGASRPHHFNGVTTVVLKLFNILFPNVAVFGAKDAQQVTVIRRMVTDLYCPVKILVGPIVREHDGLALSSRNAYLTADERAVAPTIYRGIQKVESLFKKGVRNTSELLSTLQQEYRTSSLILPEYTEIVHTLTLKPLEYIDSTALLAVACRLKESTTRLIDNTVLGGTL